ncbi:hypothetical protein [uncultured Psychroserpens sp.]|uniref:hypothetical protein n=1 Tax=uncultured Psychroserpens sp. TaxID=255436 RepID=UPI002617A8E3|nr:hypothetical protein [uncultured Psychroserpens sp.]
MQDYENLYIATYIVQNLATLVLFIGSIILFSKQRTLSTILILIGSIFIFLFGVGNIFMSAIAGRYGTEMLIKVSAFYNFFNGVVYFIFCLGIFLFTLDYIKKKKTKNDISDLGVKD